LVNDTTFDQQNNVVFVLGSLIEGWKKAIPLLRKGGEMNMYIPPSLGYGGTDMKNNAGVVIIPKNSILIFNVKLTDYSAGN
jgi:FKBP-type peptidyl-prolyl cis-trans isomerase FkpA